MVQTCMDGKAIQQIRENPKVDFLHGHVCADYEVVPMQDLKPSDFGILSVSLDEMPPHQLVGITVGVGSERLQGGSLAARAQIPT